MSFSSNGFSSSYKSKMEGELKGLRSIGNLPLIKNYGVQGLEE